MSQGNLVSTVIPLGTMVIVTNNNSNVQPLLLIVPVGTTGVVESFDSNDNTYCLKLANCKIVWVHSHWVQPASASMVAKIYTAPSAGVNPQWSLPPIIPVPSPAIESKMPTEEGVKGSGTPYTAHGPDARVEVIWDDDARAWCVIVDDEVRSTCLYRSEAIETARRVAGL